MCWNAFSTFDESSADVSIKDKLFFSGIKNKLQHVETVVYTGFEYCTMNWNENIIKCSYSVQLSEEEYSKS